MITPWGTNETTQAIVPKILKGNKNPRSVLAQIRELYAIKKGLPKGEYRSLIDKQIHALWCKLSSLEKSRKIKR